MNNTIIALSVFAAATTVALRAHISAAKVRGVNQRLASQVAVLSNGLNGLEQRRAGLGRRLADSQEQLRRRQQQVPTSPRAAAKVEPSDPAKHRGWPADREYFYLPKRNLPSVGYTVFETNRLSDSATVLFGMSGTEREAVDAAYDELWRKFRQAEIGRIQLVETPKKWQSFMQEPIAYRIGSLKQEAEVLDGEFRSALRQILGAARADYLLEAMNPHVATKLDGLGKNARVVAFGQTREPNGDKLFVYGMTTEQVGDTLEVIRKPLPADSPAAYYARLFGVPVPIESE